MKQVWITKAGEPEVLKVRETADPSPKAGEVRIRVKSSGINFADVVGRVGMYPDAPKIPYVPGYEVAGEIDAAGDGVKGSRPGDLVFAITRFGGYADTVCVPEEQVFKIPEGMSFSDAATLPINYLTAYQMLISMGSLKRGERVLIHSAGGGVGVASIDICKIYGAEIFGTASAPKHDALKARGADHLIDYRTEDFEVAVRRAAKGKGMHIILDAVGGRYWKKGLRLLAPTGRLVCYGGSDIVSGKRRSMAAFLRWVLQVPWFRTNPAYLMSANKAVIGVNVGHMWKEMGLLRGWMEEILGWYGEGKVVPTVSKEFPLAEAPAAHHYMQDRKNFGKIILVP